MEIEKESKEQIDNDFNFARKIKRDIEKKYILSDSWKKKLQFAAFIALGGVAIGLSLGATQTLAKGYLVEKQKNANIEEVQAQNEEIRKNKQFEIDSKRIAIQKDEQDKDAKKKQDEANKLNFQQEKLNYNVWLKNRSDIISNYESQLNIYEDAYKDNVSAVKNGLMSLDYLNEIRGMHQEYKNNIHRWIKFIQDSTVSFDVYYSLSENDKNALNEELIKYQSGDLNRNTDLENALLQKIGLDNDEDTDKMATMRKETRNKIIDDLADVIKNDNITTKAKKLKK